MFSGCNLSAKTLVQTESVLNWHSVCLGFRTERKSAYTLFDSDVEKIIHTTLNDCESFQ